MELKTYSKRKLFYCIPFTLFFILFRIVPMMYDGWASKFYYENSGGILNWIKYIHTMYFWYNGRISSNFVSGILESFGSEIPLDLFNALVLTGIIYLLNQLFEIKNEFKTIILYTGTIFLISNSIKNEVLFYANTAYIPTILFILMFLNALKSYLNISKEDKRIKKIQGIMYFSAFLICTWMEHIAFGFGIALTGTLIFLFVNKKKIDEPLMKVFVLAGSSGLIMMLAPGLRRSRTVIDKSVNLYGVFKDNIKFIGQEMITYNLPLMIITFTIIAIVVFQNKILKLHSKWIALFLVASYELIFIFYWYSDVFNITQRINFINFRFSPSPFWLNALFISGVFMLLLFTINLSKNRLNMIYLYIVGLISLLAVSLTPNVSARVCSIGYFILLLIMIGLFAEIEIDKKIIKQGISIFVIIVFALGMDRMILLSRRIYQIQIARTEIINEVKHKQTIREWNYDDTLYLPLFKKNDVLYRGNAVEGTFHFPQFLQAYGLDSNTKVIGTNSKFIINASIDDKSLVKVKIINPYDSKRIYNYRIKFGGGVDSDYAVDVFNSGEIATDEFEIQLLPQLGYYFISFYEKEATDINGQPKLIDQDVFFLMKP